MNQPVHINVPCSPTEMAIVGGLALLCLDNIEDPPERWRQVIDRLNRYVVHSWPEVIDDLTAMGEGKLR